MWPGFLPFSRASFSLDLVAIAMWLVIPLLCWSIAQARYRKKYKTHKTMQLSIVSLLGIAILIFEIDMRLHGWKQYAEPSAYYETLLFPVFYVHLVVAITTTLLWILTVVTALRNFDKTPKPNDFSKKHRIYGRASAFSMILTAITGWIFYTLAFIF